MVPQSNPARSTAPSVLIAGCSRVGSLLAVRLDAVGCAVRIVDSDRASFARLPTRLAGSCVEGDPLLPAVLGRAGLVEADVLVATAASDDLNAAVALIGCRIFGMRRVFVRCDDPRRARSYRNLGFLVVCRTADVVSAFERLIERAAGAGAQGV